MYNTCGNVRIFQDLSYFAESFTVNQKLQTEIVQLREQLAEAQEEVACLQIRENQLEQEKKENLEGGSRKSCPSSNQSESTRATKERNLFR